MTLRTAGLLAWVLAGLWISACSKKPEEKKGPPPTIVTVAQVSARPVQVTEETVGIVDTVGSPTVTAEVPAQVEKIFVDVGDTVKIGQPLATLNAGDLSNAQQIARAQLNSIEALLVNQEKQMARNQQLAEQNFISATRLDESISQLRSLQEQRKGAQAALNQAQRNLAKTRLRAPVSGKIEQRMVSAGDFVTAGKPLFQIATSQNLRVRLPFPENLINQFRTGLVVRLSTPAAPDKVVHGVIEDIKPMIGPQNRSFEAIVSVQNPGNWTPGASVTGTVVLAERAHALAVPETSVVIRPAGKVVYVIKNGRAWQRVVQTGEKNQGMVEIRGGLALGETIAVDGAGYLTDKAIIKIKNAAA